MRLAAVLILVLVATGCVARHTQPDGSVTEIDTRGGLPAATTGTQSGAVSVPRGNYSITAYALIQHGGDHEAARVACVDAARELGRMKRSQVDAVKGVLENAAKAEGELK